MIKRQLPAASEQLNEFYLSLTVCFHVCILHVWWTNLPSTGGDLAGAFCSKHIFCSFEIWPIEKLFILDGRNGDFF